MHTNQHIPYNTPINIGTHARPDVDHLLVWWTGICGTLISIFPYSTLINIRTHMRPDVDHLLVWWTGICGTLNRKV